MIQFQGFKPSGMEKIANAMGFQGNIKDFQKFLEDNPDRQTEMMRYQDAARQMAEGGYLKKMQTGGSIGDITAALFTSIGINSALYNREKTGKGMFIDVSMLDCQIAILENAIARYLSKNEIPKPMGSRHPSIAPFEAFKTKIFISNLVVKF